MSKKNKNSMKYNKQGIPTFDHLKSKSVGRRLEMPPDMITSCRHESISDNPITGHSRCNTCNCSWDFSGKQY